MSEQYRESVEYVKCPECGSEILIDQTTTELVDDNAVEADQRSTLVSFTCDNDECIADFSAEVISASWYLSAVALGQLGVPMVFPGSALAKELDERSTYSEREPADFVAWATSVLEFDPDMYPALYWRHEVHPVMGETMVGSVSREQDPDARLRVLAAPCRMGWKPGERKLWQFSVRMNDAVVVVEGFSSVTTSAIAGAAAFRSMWSSATGRI